MENVLILFVCKGNMVRSPIAERLFRREVKRKGLDEEISVAYGGLQGSKVYPKETKYRSLKEYTNEWKIIKPILDEKGIDIRV